MIGPSAIGSENGRPSSMRSAPDCSSASISATVRSTSGWPAVMYGTSARRPAARSSARRRSMRFAVSYGAPRRRSTVSGEVVEDSNTISMRSRSQDIHFTHLRYVLVSAPADTEQYHVIFGPASSLRGDPAHGVRRLQRGDDPFESAEQTESLERVAV